MEQEDKEDMETVGNYFEFLADLNINDQIAPMSGRVTGMCKWRCGWRADVLRLRNGQNYPSPTMLNQEEEQTTLSNVDAEMFVETSQSYMLYDLSMNGKISQNVGEAWFEKAWLWWKMMWRGGEERYVCGPMIGQSELVFRLLCRENRVGLCYTPMYLAGAVLCE